MIAKISSDKLTLIVSNNDDLAAISEVSSKLGFYSKLRRCAGLWLVIFDNTNTSCSLAFIQELTKVVQTSIDIKIER